MATKSARKKGHSKSNQDLIKREFNRSKALRIFALIGSLVLAGWIIVALLEPTPEYRLVHPVQAPSDSADFIRELEGLTGAPEGEKTAVEPFYNGESFYEAELAAMHAAQHSINLEAYVFKPGEIAKRAVATLTERAHAGIHVNVVLDAVGSDTVRKRFFHELTAAGGHVAWYHPLRWDNWFRFNNRTHRELLVVDGRIAFLGGAGYADYWYTSTRKEPRWRDSMFRVEGDGVVGLQSAFVENWVESSGQIITGSDYFPAPIQVQGHPALMVASSPSMGGSTTARILFTALISAAHRSIDICTPYFIPDKGLRDELARAAHDRGVRVRILVPGDHTDHKVVRASSRSNYGELLEAGAEVYEYRPAMIHEKLLIVDDDWVVVGSTNMDTRSFGINDEVNLAVLDPALATRITEQYERDLGESQSVSLEKWKHRSVWERGIAWLGFLWSRQQ